MMDDDERLPGAADEHGPTADLRSSADGRDSRGRFTPQENSGRKRGSRKKLPRDVRQLVADHAADIVKAMIDKARNGHVNAGAALLRLVVAPAKEQGEPIRIDLKKITTAVEAAAAIGDTIAATTCGKVSPDAARHVVAMIATLAKSIETADLERRLAAIEAALQKNGNTK